MLQIRQTRSGARRRRPRSVLGQDHGPIDPRPDGTPRARGSAGDRPVEIGEVDLAQTARAVAAGLGASDRVVLGIPEGNVATDPGRIAEVLTDLVGYALTHARDGSSVRISADSEKSELRLWITGRGVEIDPVDLGLGLRLAGELLEDLRGRVQITNSSVGGTFAVTLPTNGAASAPSRERSSAPAA
jgi:signal transduction histidine kinase